MQKFRRKWFACLILLVMCMNMISGTVFSASSPLPSTVTVDQYQRIDLGPVGGLPTSRGGLNYYKGKIPIGGNMTDGGSITLPWFSSNVKHLQSAVTSGNNFKANALYVLCSGAWWGNHLEGQPVLKLTVKSPTSQTFETYLVSGVNFSEWNAGVPATMAKNTEKIGIVDPYCSSSYITRFELPLMDVSTINIDLVNQTKADNSKTDGQPCVEFYGMTLARENLDSYNLNPQFNAKNMEPGTISKFKKLVIGLPSDVPGKRGGEVYFKDKVPVGGSVADGTADYIPWFSSNPKHVQKRTLDGGGYKANTLYVFADCAWWPSADTLVGKPLLRLRINDNPAQDMFIVSGYNIWEWNDNVPDTIAANTVRIPNRDSAVSNSYLTKFEFPETVINKVDVELINPTAAKYSAVDGQQVIELFGVTLGNENTGNFTSTPITTTPVSTPAVTPSVQLPVTNGKASLNGLAIDLGVKLWWDEFSTPNMGYRLYRSTDPNSDGISVTDFPIQTTNFVDPNVNPSTKYYYKVRALLKEANPLQGLKEALSDPLNVCEITTKDVIKGNDPSRTGSKNFILMKLDDPYMTVAGQKKEVDPGRKTAPIIVKNRTMIPIRSAVEAMGGTVDWIGSEGKILIKYNNTELIMWLNKKEISVNGVKKEIDVAPESINGRTMVPVRFVAENLKTEIEWIASTREIVVIFWD